MDDIPYPPTCGIQKTKIFSICAAEMSTTKLLKLINIFGIFGQRESNLICPFLSMMQSYETHELLVASGSTVK